MAEPKNEAVTSLVEVTSEILTQREAFVMEDNVGKQQNLKIEASEETQGLLPPVNSQMVHPNSNTFSPQDMNLDVMTRDVDRLSITPIKGSNMDRYVSY